MGPSGSVVRRAGSLALAAAERGRFAAVDSTLVGQLTTDPGLAVFAPERRDESMDYCGLACPCGSTVFHVAGWPRIASGRGGFFWRALSRVFREARMPMQDGELLESPFRLPVFARCDACGREEVVLDAEGVVDRMPAAARQEPRESARCRVCRRGSVALVLGATSQGAAESRFAVELVTICTVCRRQARIAWSDARPSEQEARLDLLYGRR